MAVIPGAGLNFQLDCNEPCAAPTSIAVASFASVEGSFTLGDFIGGLLAGAFDVALTKLVSMISSAVVEGLEGPFLAGVGFVIMGAFGVEGLLAAGLVAIGVPTIGEFVKEAAETGIGWLIGTPLGYSFKLRWTGIGGTANDAINDFVSNLISPPPTPSTP